MEEKDIFKEGTNDKKIIKIDHNTFGTIFNDRELLKNLRTIFLLLIILTVVIFYFAGVDKFDFGKLLNFGVGALVFITIISIRIVYIDFGVRAFEDGCKLEDIVKCKDDLKEEQNKVHDNLKVAEFTDYYNKEQQKFYNKIYTTKFIDDLEDKITIKELNGKNTDKLIKTKERLTKLPKKDKSYKKILPLDLLTLNKEKGDDKDKKGRDSIEYDPKSDGKNLSLLLTIIKSSLTSSTGALIFAMQGKWIDMFRYLGALILVLSYTSLQRYIKVRRKTEIKYLISIKNKLDLIKEMNVWIKKEETN